MVRIVFATALSFALLSPAIAAPTPAPKGPIDLSHTRCESPKVIARIKTALPTMQVAGGRAFMSTFLGDNSNLTATTLEATKDELDCRITVNFFIHSAPRTVIAKWVVRALPTGGVTELFDPGD